MPENYGLSSEKMNTDDNLESDTMTNKLKNIRTTLEQMKKHLTVNIDKSKPDSDSGSDIPEDNTSVKKDEVSNITMDMERRLALKHQMNNSLVIVERALQKIDDGSYGICDNCKKPIDPARMEALPHSIFCWICSSTCGK